MHSPCHLKAIILCVILLFYKSRVIPGNIRNDEEEQFKAMAKYVLALTDDQLNQLVANGQFEEVEKDD